MKQIIALILATGLLCCLFACADEEGAETDGDTAKTDTTALVETDAPTENVETDPPKTETAESEPDKPETAWAAETDELGRWLDPLGLPWYEKGTYVIKSADKWEIWDVTRDDFFPFIDYLRANGFDYDPTFSANEMSEQEALAMDLWFGSKDGKRLTVFFSVDLRTWENYLDVSVSDID